MAAAVLFTSSVQADNPTQRGRSPMTMRDGSKCARVVRGGENVIFLYKISAMMMRDSLHG
jgi:hypothetical protein